MSVFVCVCVLECVEGVGWVEACCSVELICFLSGTVPVTSFILLPKIKFFLSSGDLEMYPVLKKLITQNFSELNVIFRTVQSLLIRGL
jgi:hypothetical protein